MCVLYVSVVMGSAVLLILRSRLVLYSGGSRGNRVKVDLSGFSMRLFCFVQARTSCKYVFLGVNSCLCV